MKKLSLTNSASLVILTTYIVLSSILLCSAPTGGGSEAGNAKIIGKVVDSSGTPIANVLVNARTSSYDPVKPSQSDINQIDTTDSNGVYRFSVNKGTTYTVNARYPIHHTSALISQYPAIDDENSAPECTLKLSGTVKIQLPENTDKLHGYVYIPGTDIYSFINSINDFVVLNNVPASKLPLIYYSSTQQKNHSTIRQDIPVKSGDTSVVYNTTWRYSQDFLLNTTSSGANISDTLLNFPVCIRLSHENFKFDQANSDGSDIRFTKNDNSPLTYEIEGWDVVNQRAVIWVKIDTVFGNDSTHFYSMYWGNPAAKSVSNSTTVFDTSRGFQGVWHLSGNGADVATDATINQYDGTLYKMSTITAVTGAIGNARYFDGVTNYIAMPNTSTGKLDIAQNGSYSISLWAYADTIDSLWHVLAGKGHEQYYLKFKCFHNQKASWEFVEFQDKEGWNLSEDSVPSAPGSKQWVYLTGVRSGAAQYLYVNGMKVDDSISLMTGDYPRNTTDDFSIGRYIREVTIPYIEGWCYFKGKIDEVRVMNVALSADWIKLSYMNQKEKDALVVFR